MIPVSGQSMRELMEALVQAAEWSNTVFCFIFAATGSRLEWEINPFNVIVQKHTVFLALTWFYTILNIPTLISTNSSHLLKMFHPICSWWNLKAWKKKVQSAKNLIHECTVHYVNAQHKCIFILGQLHCIDSAVILKLFSSNTIPSANCWCL